jgi:hypothetical protein
MAALLAGDLEHHPGCAPSIPAGSRRAPSPERASRSLFEYRSAHENADADEQEHHDDEGQGHRVVLRRGREERHQRAPVKEKGRPESRPRRPRRRGPGARSSSILSTFPSLARHGAGLAASRHAAAASSSSSSCGGLLNMSTGGGSRSTRHTDLRYDDICSDSPNHIL